MHGRFRLRLVAVCRIHAQHAARTDPLMTSDEAQHICAEAVKQQRQRQQQQRQQNSMRVIGSVKAKTNVTNTSHHRPIAFGKFAAGDLVGGDSLEKRLSSNASMSARKTGFGRKSSWDMN